MEPFICDGNVNRANYMYNVDTGKSPKLTCNPSHIGENVTISDSSMHEFVAKELTGPIKMVKNPRVLDVGSGSGILTVILSCIAGKDGKVIGVERLKRICDRSIVNVNNDGKGSWLKTGRIEFIHGGYTHPRLQGMKFDAISVGAAAEKLDDSLLNLLANGGTMIIPLGTGESQNMTRIKKDKHGNITKEELLPVRYVPLFKE